MRPHMRIGARRFQGLSRGEDNSGADETNISPLPKYPSSRKDVYHVAFLLKQVLNQDLVGPILDYAEYWISTRTQLANALNVTNRPRGQMVITTPGLASAQEARRVRRIVFTVKSHDQGHTSEPNSDSWTWFEGHVAKPGDYLSQVLPGNRARSAESRKHDRDETPTEDGIIQRPPNANPWDGRRLITNATAQLQPRIQQRIWERDAPDEEDREMIQKLGEDDRVVLTAHACFPQWWNHVEKASIDVYIAGVW